MPHWFLCQEPDNPGHCGPQCPASRPPERVGEDEHECRDCSLISCRQDIRLHQRSRRKWSTKEGPSPCCDLDFDRSSLTRGVTPSCSRIKVFLVVCSCVRRIIDSPGGAPLGFGLKISPMGGVAARLPLPLRTPPGIAPKVQAGRLLGRVPGSPGIGQKH
jgi:hypothetical protein